MRNFPNYYKYTSLELYINDEVSYTERKTMNILDMLAKVGGLFGALKGAMMIFVSMFSMETINS